MNLPELNNSGSTETVQANYNKLSEHIRRLTPHGFQCSVFCGGINCKYENPENWKPDSLAIQGIYSHWVTDDILAMARPSTLVIIQKNVIQQFESLGIKSIINLQCPNEHSSCGQPLESSGFSYEPNVFMERNIYYYNFAWKDYGDATLDGLINMVKVLAFALTEGRVAIHCHAGANKLKSPAPQSTDEILRTLQDVQFKTEEFGGHFVSFGLNNNKKKWLGRTGVLISCYLVFSLRVTANDAIRYVRLKRPGSVQTRGQILCVRHFAQFILPQSITFFLKDNVPKDKYMNEFTLQRLLKRQKVVLHGYEERNFKYLPKIVYVICERILKLCACSDHCEEQLNIPFTTDFLAEKIHGAFKRYESSYSIASPNSETIFLNPPCESPTTSSPNPSEACDSSDNFSEISTLDGDELNEDLLLENKCFQELETQKIFTQDHLQEELVVQDVEEVVKAFLKDFGNSESKRNIREFENEINTSKMGWLRLSLETDVSMLVRLLLEWLEGLKVPILQVKNFEDIVILYKQPEECFKRLGMEEAYLIEYLLKFVSKLQPIREEHLEEILKRLIASLSKHTVSVSSIVVPSGKGFKRIGDGTLHCSVHFFKSLLKIVDNHHKQKAETYVAEEKHSDNETDDLIGFQ